MHPNTFRLSLVLLFIGLIGAIFIFSATRETINISYDSVYYLDGAYGISNSGSFATVQEGEIEPVVSYPPLYSFVLALFSQFGVKMVSAARTLNILFYALNIFLGGLIFYRITGGNISWSIVFSLIILMAWPLMDIHLWVWADPFLIFLINLGLLMLAEFLRKPKLSYLFMAMICIALAPLVRYSGLLLMPVLFFAIALYFPLESRRKFAFSTVITSISLLPSLLWFFRNYWITGTITGRKASFSFISFDKMEEFSDTISSWLIYPAVDESYRIYLFFIFLMFWLIVVLFNLRQRKIHLLYFRSKQNLFLLKIFNLFIVFYILYIIGYYSFFNSGIPVDNRILAPCFIPFLAIVFHTLFLWQKFSESNKIYRYAISILLILFLTTNIWYWLGAFNIVDSQHAQTYYKNIKYEEPVPTSKRIPSGKLILDPQKISKNHKDFRKKIR